MTTFDARDMTAFIESLGTTVVITEIDQKIEFHYVDETRKEVERGGFLCLKTRYSPLVTMMDRCEKLAENVQRGIAETIVEALRGMDEAMVNCNNDVKTLSPEDFKDYQQIVSIALFMAYKCLEEFGFCSSVRNNDTVHSKGRNHRGGNSFSSRPKTQFGFWPKIRDRLLEALFSLVQKNLFPFWERIKKPNGRTFYGLIIRALVSAVKYEANDVKRNNIASQMVVSLFSYLITEHNFEDDITTRLMQNVLDSEDVSQATSKVIGELKERCRTGIVGKAILVAFDLVNQPENRDKWDKGFTSFLLEMGTNYPEDIYETSLPLIMNLIDADSVPMRTAIVFIIVKLIGHNSEQIAKTDNGPAHEKAIKLQRTLIEHMAGFMRDANASVRTKVREQPNIAVNAVTSLINMLNEGIKLIDLIPLIHETGERILDASPTVRRSSFSVFNALIQSDPALGKHTPIEFRTKVLDIRRGLVSRRTQNIVEVPVRLRIVVKEFTDQLEETDMGLTLQSLEFPEDWRDNQAALEHIQSLLKEGMYWEACEAFYRCGIELELEVFQVVNIGPSLVYTKFFSSLMGIEYKEREEIPDTYETDMLETAECVQQRSFLTHMHTLEALSVFLYTKVVRTILKLLRHGVASDQAEVMAYLAFLTECKYPLPPYVPVHVLDSISRVDKTAVSHIVAPFVTIFMNRPECRTPLGFVKTLVGLVSNLGTEKRNHMKLLIQEMVRSKKLHIESFKVLWDMVILGVPDCGEAEAKIALYILGTCAIADRNSIQSLFDPIIEVGLGPRGCQDMEFAAAALAAVFETLRKRNEELSNKKLPADHPLFDGIFKVIRHGLVPETTDQANNFFSKVVDLGISLIYECCLNPAKAISPIISGSFLWIFGPEETAEDEKDVSLFETNEKLMLKFLSLAGAITGSHASYHSKWVLDEVKRRKTLTALEDSAAMRAVKMRLRDSMVEIHRRKSIGNGRIAYTKSIDDQILKADEEELDAVVGQVGFDKETELVRNFMDKLLEEGMFRFYWHNIVLICRRFKHLKSQCVRVAAIRLLVKLMLVGQKALSGLMEIYIGLWREVKSTAESVELVLSAILLNDCYPNQMNAVNGIVIEGLKSESAEVRQATLDFVTYLTLNDVLKLREILPDTICRLSDQVEDIREVTKLFLKECHEKDTMLHSAIPDMIIRLSSTDDLTEDQFQQVMRDLLEPVKKVTEVVGIGTKLLERFGSGKLKRGREAQNNALCLSLLNFNDKFFKTVRDNLPLYEKYLDDTLIYECFLKILKSAKENLKPEAKEKFEAYEEKLLEARQNASELRRMDTASRDPNASMEVDVRAAESSSSAEASEADEPNERPAARARGRKSGSNDDEDEEPEASQTSSRGSRSTANGTLSSTVNGSMRSTRSSARVTRSSARPPVRRAAVPVSGSDSESASGTSIPVRRGRAAAPAPSISESDSESAPETRAPVRRGRAAALAPSISESDSESASETETRASVRRGRAAAPSISDSDSESASEERAPVRRGRAPAPISESESE